MYRQAVGRTAWPARMGVLTALLVGVLPLLLIVLAALVAGAAVYAVCKVLARIGEVLTGSGSQSTTQDNVSNDDDPLRDNVRVMPRV